MGWSPEFSGTRRQTAIHGRRHRTLHRTQYQKMHFGSPCALGVLGVNTDPRRVVQPNVMFPEKPSPDVLAYSDIPVAIGTATPENELFDFKK